MRHTTFVLSVSAASLAAILAGSARAETLGEQSGVNSALGIAPTTKDFVTEAAISDMFEVRSSQLAETRTRDNTKSFAAQMVKDHTETTAQLKPLAEKAHVDVPEKLDDTHQKMLDKLKGLKGDDFTKQYHSDQESGHKTAVALFKRYAKGGENAALKSWADKTLPHLQEHLKMAEDPQQVDERGGIAQLAVRQSEGVEHRLPPP